MEFSDLASIFIVFILCLLLPPFERKEKEYTSLNINKKIDKYIRQGKCGDCWVLAPLLALSYMQIGSKIIKNAIKINRVDVKNITIYFKGINKSYDITANEIKNYSATEYAKESDFINGDNDVLIFEIGIAKLRPDIANKIVEFDDKFNNYCNGEKINMTNAINFGYASAMFYYLTGKKQNLKILTIFQPAT